MHRVPEYLRSYVSEQNYDAYTARDHACWRYIMRNAREYFKEHAHKAYLLGLKKTGISISKIPKIEDMDRVLRGLGWGAVCVRGYIPPLVFLDFQAHRILPIAGNMRSLEHIDYTPAPDIVHEAAGHAPFLADKNYSVYLASYAKLARKAIFSHEDMRLYEAVRALSDAKENSDCTPEEIKKAEKDLETAIGNVTFTSEASLVARFYWWTAEYGLILDSLGEKDPKIYGAGLLSSLGEGRSCLRKEVKKKLIDLKCVGISFDITEPQPQLFVAKSFSQLIDLLKKLEATLAFKKGGFYGIQTALKAQTVCTVQLPSKIEISGIISESVNTASHPRFVRWKEPTQLAIREKQIAGFARADFSGETWLIVSQGEKKFKEKLKRVKDLEPIREKIGGFVLEADFRDKKRLKPGYFVYELENASLQKGTSIVARGKKIRLLLAGKIPSVYGGPADWQAYGAYDLGRAASLPNRSSPFSQKELAINSLYNELAELREASLQKKEVDLARIERILASAQDVCPEEWLVAVQLVELLSGGSNNQEARVEDIEKQYLKRFAGDLRVQNFLKDGFALAKVSDG